VTGLDTRITRGESSTAWAHRSEVPTEPLTFLETVATAPGDFRVLVPTLCVGMPAGPLCGPHREDGQAERPRGPEDDAERRRRHSHAGAWEREALLRSGAGILATVWRSTIVLA
jgi:hypothetical protein